MEEPHTRGCGVRIGRPDYMVVVEEAHLPPSSCCCALSLIPSTQTCSGGRLPQEQALKATHYVGWLFVSCKPFRQILRSDPISCADEPRGSDRGYFSRRCGDGTELLGNAAQLYDQARR